MTTLRIDGRILHYHATPEALSGHGPVLALVHGAGGTLSLFGALTSRLRAIGIPVLRLDLPGHGRSDLPGEESVSAYATVVSRWLEALEAHSVVLAGHSMGGAIAMELALQRPSWLGALVLLSTGARLRVLPSFLASLERHDRSALDLYQQVGFGAGTDPEILRASFEDLSRCDPEVLYRDFLACDRFDSLDRVHQIDLATLIGCGEEDQMTPLNYSRFLHDRISGSRLIVFSDTGHMLPLERPEELAQAISEFWHQCRSTGDL